MRLMSYDYVCYFVNFWQNISEANYNAWIYMRLPDTKHVSDRPGICWVGFVGNSFGVNVYYSQVLFKGDVWPYSTLAQWWCLRIAPTLLWVRASHLPCLGTLASSTSLCST